MKRTGTVRINRSEHGKKQENTVYHKFPAVYHKPLAVRRVIRANVGSPPQRQAPLHPRGFEGPAGGIRAAIFKQLPGLKTSPVFEDMARFWR